ncbi:uncharacterized protein LOC128214710 [Mya arenaria]|uniref:uncharacterized protein LOC128214710 n=1 Tax=Mya arenaria TaxID=6604 RepID=UPI0022E8E4A5|nr:uncharacterized protein LOC128214710 [Mya arenaria]
MDHDPDNYRVMSLRLSRVLNDIGVNNWMIRRRRRTFLAMKIDGINNHYINSSVYCFGSQIEGTTTLGMMSDTDMLVCDNSRPAILDWTDWKLGKTALMVAKTEQSQPGYCNLQILSSAEPLPVTFGTLHDDINEELGKHCRVLLNTIGRDPNMIFHIESGFQKMGRRMSFSEDNDIVFAFHCSRIPKECKFLFHRPRPGHWPRSDVLEKIRECGTFIVPQSYTKSMQSKFEWKFSTSMMERLLMFDLSTIQLKTFTFLKMVSKTYIKPIVGDRLSTFHLKTAFLFTIESYPPDIWKEHNILQCVNFCLSTLQRWFRIRICPQYTIAGVDLFLGKLRKNEFTILLQIVSAIKNNVLPMLIDISMDQLGQRMLQLLDSSEPTNILSSRLHCLQITALHCLERMLNINFRLLGVNEIGIALPNDKWERYIYDLNIRITYGYLASIKASNCIKLQQPICADIYKLYNLSLDSDLTSTRLKFASMLYCIGKFCDAVAVLDNTEQLLHSNVWQFSPHSLRGQCEPTDDFLWDLLRLPVGDVIKTSVALSVIFSPLERHCLPKHLANETNLIGYQESFEHELPILEKMKEFVMIDSIPYLHYLQYLSYRELDQCDRKRTALQKLQLYVFERSKGYGHIDTAANVLGHCYELENMFDEAWHCYSESLRHNPHNNAAKGHITRIIQHGAL